MTNQDSGIVGESRRSLIILAVGGVIGLVLAIAGFIDLSGTDGLPDGIIARVNDANIHMDRYQTAIKFVSDSKRWELTEKDHTYILERLIEEELLVQRGIELGMIKSDNVVRNTIVQKMIKTICLDTAAEDISTEKLNSFYEDNSDLFKTPERLQIRQMSFNATSHSPDNAFEKTLNKAHRAHEALKKGHSFQSVKNRYTEPSIIEIPNSLLPVGKVREYLGPGLLAEIKKLKPGEFTRPLKTAAGYIILILTRYDNPGTQKLEIISDQVEAEYRKRRDDDALRSYLDHLKDWADIKRIQI
jgi:hypothetical protein